MKHVNRYTRKRKKKKEKKNKEMKKFEVQKQRPIGRK
jgi:hypothetical protein